jgi:1-acyl-sn-glycerol-3-phosphate acyltransferase
MIASERRIIPPSIVRITPRVPQPRYLKVRGAIAMLFISVSLLVLDPVQRLVIAPWVWLRPASRHRVLGAWAQLLAWLTSRPLAIIGGAHVPSSPAIPFEPGVLIIMNHQSLLDIPLVVRCIKGGYAVVVARKRYVRWIPLVSHLIRLYGYPVVDPLASPDESKKMIRALRSTARTTDVPIVVFAEGTRTRDGEIGPFMTTGLSLILRARPWTVYAMVGDGFWQWATFKQLVFGAHKIRGCLELVDRFEWTDTRGDSRLFVAQIRDRMVEHLAGMRAAETQ